MRRQNLVPACAAIALALPLAACTQEGSSEAATSAETGLRQIDLGIFPGATFGSLKLAEREGIFEKHGIALELNMGQGGAELLPGVSSGDLDIAVGNPVSVMQANTQGLDIGIIAGYAYDGPAENDTSAVVAMPETGIGSAKDLVGKTVAINTHNGALELGIRESVRLDGGDPDGVEFVEVGFPDMPAQLAAGNVDAICVGQPFMGTVLEGGGEIVLESQKESGTGGTILVTFTSARFREENPELIENFTAAWDEALTFAQANPDKLRAELPEFFDMDPAIAEGLPLEGLSADLDMAGLQAYADLMIQYGVVDTAPDLDALVWTDNAS